MIQYKKVDSNAETWQQMCSQTWGLVMYFLGALPETREEWENDKNWQAAFFDLPTWVYHIQAMSKHYQRLTREGEHGQSRVERPGESEEEEGTTPENGSSVAGP